MKIGYNEATARDCSNLEKDLILCEKYGFDYIEIRIEMLREYLSTHKAEELKYFFDNHRLKPKVFNSCREINFRTEKDWQGIVNDLLLACETSNLIGCNCMIAVPSPIKCYNYYTKEEVLNNTYKCLNELLDISKDYNMQIAFEPVGKSYIPTIKQAWSIIKHINNDRLGLAIDAFNLYMHEKSNDFSDIKILDVDKIYIVHIDDAEEVPLEKLGQHHRCFPLEGVIDLKNFIDNLKEINYDGVVSVETFRPEYWAKDADWVIENAFISVKKLLKSA